MTMVLFTALTLAGGGSAAAPGLPLTTYSEVRERVAAGEKIVMLVRPPAGRVSAPHRSGYTTVRCDDAPLSPGRYDCERIGGQPCLNVVESYAPAPATAEGWHWLLRGT